MDLLTELRDDLRADKAQRLWENYGKWVIYTAISIIIVTAVLVYHNHHQRTLAMKHADAYFAANHALAKGEAEQALKILDAIDAKEGSDFHDLVLLKKIAIGETTKNPKLVETTKTALARSSGVYSDVGKLLTVDENTQESALPFSSQERTAWALLTKNKKADALTIFKQLAANEEAPASLRDRARMVHYYLTIKQANHE